MAFLRIKFTIPDLSKIVLTPEQVVARAITAVDKVVDDAEQDWGAVVYTWTHKPKFHRVPASLKGGIVSGSVSSTDKNLIRLNNGTRTHKVGKRGQLMAFHPKRQNKTVPRSIGSGRGGPLVGTGARGKHGAKLVRRGPWTVKGIRPREFDVAIAAKHRRDLLDFGKQLRP